MGGRGKRIVNQGQHGLRHGEFQNSADYKSLSQKEKYNYLFKYHRWFLNVITYI